jgi:hypothetical protein
MFNVEDCHSKKLYHRLHSLICSFPAAAFHASWLCSDRDAAGRPLTSEPSVDLQEASSLLTSHSLGPATLTSAYVTTAATQRRKQGKHQDA